MPIRLAPGRPTLRPPEIGNRCLFYKKLQFEMKLR